MFGCGNRWTHVSSGGQQKRSYSPGLQQHCSVGCTAARLQATWFMLLLFDNQVPCFLAALQGGTVTEARQS